VTWREEDHPRDDSGRFTDDWAGAVVSRLTPGSGYVRGRDLFDELDYDEIYDLQDENVGGIERNQVGDLRLAAIWKAQGFDGPPRVVDHEQFERDSRDHKVLYRGIRDFRDLDDGLIATGRQLAEQYRTGPVYPGRGYHGNGTYASSSMSEATLYTHPSSYGSAENVGGTVMRMYLVPEARIADEEDLQADAQKYGNNWVNPDTRDEVLADVGRLASVRGYDAIRLEDSQTIVVLNRTAVVVEEATE
jgi:hypothetical protein